MGRCGIEVARTSNSIPGELIYDTGILPEQWRDPQVNEPKNALIRDSPFTVQHVTDNMRLSTV